MADERTGNSGRAPSSFHDGLRQAKSACARRAPPWTRSALRRCASGGPGRETSRTSSTTLWNVRAGNRDTLACSEDHIDENGEFGKNVRAGRKPECRRLELQRVKRKQRRNRGSSGLRGNGRSWHGRRRKWHRNGRIQYRSRRIQHRNGRHDNCAIRPFRD